MRARNIKPGFFKNDELAALPPLVRILFQGLWCYADYRGNLEDRPARIKIEILPYDDCNVVEMIDALEEAGFVQRYLVNGARYLHIPKFLKHQNPHKNERLKGSKIPQPLSSAGENLDTEAYFAVSGAEHPSEAQKSSFELESSGLSSVPVPDGNGSRHADSGSLIPESGLQCSRVEDSTRKVPGSSSGTAVLTAPPSPGATFPTQITNRETFKMTPDWSPGTSFSDRLAFAGCAASQDFWRDCLPEFVLYREAAGERKTQAQWEHKFLQDVLHKFARSQSTRMQNAPKPLAENWQPDAPVWAVIEKRGIDHLFARDRFDEFVLFWREDGGARRSWNALFVDWVQRRWNERSTGRADTWSNLNDTSWAAGIIRLPEVLECDVGCGSQGRGALAVRD